MVCFIFIPPPTKLKGVYRNQRVVGRSVGRAVGWAGGRVVGRSVRCKILRRELLPQFFNNSHEIRRRCLPWGADVQDTFFDIST